ncbi:hypothetical protein [Corynebacterium sp. AOP12-C2-36]|uniref:hypothetical protein n=1 Tax=Corynebacterium sp. AOP12-C2-36 TaxID=3457723 RepID=UPI004033C775
MSKLKTAPKWAIRKILYFAAAAVVAILGAFGVLSEVQVDQWTDQLDKILPYAFGVLAPLIAGAKTNAGSDSTATAADVAAAAQVDTNAVASEVYRRITDVAQTGQHALTTATQAATSVADHYRR